VSEAFEAAAAEDEGKRTGWYHARDPTKVAYFVTTVRR
jgi:hypothetical protein